MPPAAARRRSATAALDVRRRCWFARSAPAVEELLEARRERQARSTRASARLPPRDARRPRGDWTVAPLPGRPPRPPRRDHRAGRPQDDHQRAQLGRERLHGRLRGLDAPDLGQPASTARSTCATRCAARSTLRRARDGQALRARPSRPATLLVRPRGWHLAEKHVRVDGEPVSGVALRLRPLLLPQRARAARARHRPVLLPAEAGEPPRGAALERRVRRARRTRSASRAARSRRRC